jgi:ATP-dependent Clp protease ATP-binding subunit ClpA
MFERFTDRARQTVVLAQEEARDLAHDFIGTEHLLLGLLRESEGTAAVALRLLGVELAGTRAAVAELIGRGTESPAGNIPFTPRSKKVLELSLREALALGHNYIGTEHILLGLVREGEGVGAQVLVQQGAMLPLVRATVLEQVRRAGTTHQSAPARTLGAEEVVTIAQELAASSPVGSQHLLEALARSDDTVAAKVLAALGVDADAIAAKIDELGIEGTSDVIPGQAAARQMEVRLDGREVHVVLRDETAVELVRTLTEAVGGPLRGDDSAVGSLMGLWKAILGELEALRRRVAPLPEEVATGTKRSAILRQAIEHRLARRRRSR